MAEHEDGPLSLRQPRERSAISRRRSRLSSESSGDGPPPATRSLKSRSTVAAVGPARAGRRHRDEPTFAARSRLDAVQAPVDQDAREPHVERQLLAERGKVRVRLDEGVLHGLVRLGRVAQIVIRDATGAPLMSRHQLGVAFAGLGVVALSLQALTADAAEPSASLAAASAAGAPDMKYATRSALFTRAVTPRVAPSHYRRAVRYSDGASSAVPAIPQGRPKASEFVFARLRYDSGDWDYNPKVAANVLNSIVEYTTIPTLPRGGRDHGGLEGPAVLSLPVHDGPQAGAVQSRRARPAEGLCRARRVPVLRRLQPRRERACTRRVSRRRCARCSLAPSTLAKLPMHHGLYRSFFPFPDGPPTTSHELNGWGDDIVHDYLRAVEHRGRIGVLYQQQGLRMRMGLRLAEQAIPARGQHQVRGQYRGLRDDGVTLVIACGSSVRGSRSVRGQARREARPSFRQRKRRPREIVREHG